MDPANPASFNHQYATLSTGRRYHYVDSKPDNYDSATSISLVCIHGFPDIWYGWRYQIKPWVEQGYRVVVFDKLGYGESEKPEDAIHYTSKRIADDVAALMDHLEIPKAVILGHDWGSFMASRFALWHPDRLLALVILSVPYVPPQEEYVSLEQIVEKFPNWGYQLYFREKSTNAEIEGRLDKFFKLLYRARRDDPKLAKWVLPGGLKEILNSEGDYTGKGFLNQQEHAYYVSQFADSMNGPLNYYRTNRYRWEEEREGGVTVPRSDLPVLLIAGKEDPTCNQGALGVTKKLIPQVQIELIDGVGHWIMIQSAQHVTESVLRFVQNALANGTTSTTKL